MEGFRANPSRAGGRAPGPYSMYPLNAGKSATALKSASSPRSTSRVNEVGSESELSARADDGGRFHELGASFPLSNAPKQFQKAIVRLGLRFPPVELARQPGIKFDRSELVRHSYDD
jgi:hypothetical protein